MFSFHYKFYIKKIRSEIQLSFPDDTTASGNLNTSCSAGDPLALDVMRNIIDRDIARLEESIRVLKSRRNELSPISRLPAEILCNIFSFAEVLSQTWSPESWTNFSQVSQHWRSLALRAPELWTKIPLAYPRWAQEMLIRSKKAKLTIRSDNSSSLKAIQTLRLCLYEMNRIEEINLTAIPGSLLEEIFWDLPKHAPQLHTLRIESPPLSEAFPIFENFLYDTKRLRRVELSNCKISWDSRLLTGLTRLTLIGPLNANSSIIKFLHALQQMPALTHLYLEDSIPDYIEGSSYPVVNLPCIQTLSISSGVGPLTGVLRHITIPHITIFRLTCKENQSTQIDFSNFLSVLATKFLSSFVIRSLSLRVRNDEMTQTHGLEFDLWTAPSLIYLFLTWPSSQPHNHENALTCAFNALSLLSLIQLQISTEDHIDSWTWVKTFGKLPLLKKVWVQSYSPRPFLEALVYKRKAAEKSKTAYHTVSFPNLRYIHLEGIDFDATDPTSISMLIDCLMERYERKAEVEVLHLEDCYYISSEDVERFKEIVVDVIWDGVEQELSGEDSEEDSEGYHSPVDDSDDDDSSSSVELW